MVMASTGQRVVQQPGGQQVGGENVPTVVELDVRRGSSNIIAQVYSAC